MGARQRIKRFIVSLLIIGFIGGSIFVVLKYTDLISFHCTVTFDGNGYELEEDEVFVKKNETVDLPELNREGYTFHGWYLGEVKWTEDKKITSNVTLIAKWSPISYDITFFVGDETFIQKANYDTIPTFDGTPTKENADESKEFKFIGWEPALTVVKGNAFYTAKFQEVVKTFDINVTMMPANAGIVTGAGEYEYGTVANISITPNNGYEFLGWFNTDDSLHSTNNALSFPNIKNDVNLIAKFNVINKNIYYKDIPQECSNSNPDTYNIINGIIKLAGLEKPGYTFRGWFTESEGNGEKISTIDSSTLVDYTLYAYFTPTQYTINYHLNGGSLALNAPRLYTIESDNFALVSPTKDRFIFIGWTSPDHPEPTKDITIEQGSCGNKEFTAHWTIATYTITFDVNGTTYNQEVEDGQIPMFNGDTTIPDTPYARVTFIGWQPSIVPAKENAIYKALYSYDYKKYTVQLATNIYNAGILTGTGSYNWGTDVNITATENTGFKFIGWYQNGQLISENRTYKIEKIAKSVSIEARFEMLTSTITYNDVPDGIINNNPTSYDIFDGIITLKDLDIAGYTFEGWFDERNGKGNRITEINCLAFTDYTLYAHIIIKNYTITYDLDGGEVYTTNPTSYNINTDTFTINNPIKEHYTFLGWTTLENNTPNTTITVTKGSLGDKVFKAKWKANLYDITFIVDGVSEIKKFEYNTMPDYGKTPIKAPDDGGLTTYSFTGWLPQLALVSGNATYTAQFDSNIETFTLTLNASPTSGGSIQGGGTYAYNANIQISAIPNTGYTFAGWYKDNTIYNSNANVTINGLTANTTLTAKFDIITATISYENTKGASNPNPTSYNINTSDIPLKDISVNGYTFNGWYTGENGSGSKITTINTSSLENYRLYANLEVIPYTITYYLNGGDPLSNPTTYNVETPTFTLNNPTKTGYTFAGWKLSNTGNPIKNITITQGSTGDKEYTAYYTINKYTVTFKGYDMNIEITDKYEYNDKANKYYTSDIASSLENKIIDGANCTFLGWALQENSSSYIDLNNYPITNNTTFFAIFDITRNSYYVTIDTNKSSAIGSLSYTIDGITNEITSTTSNSITIEHGKSITLNITISNTKGYTFNGWEKDGSLIANSNTNSYTIQNVQSSTTLISQFSCKTYNITYDTQALKGAYNPNTRTTYTIEDSNIILQDPTLTGYAFKGWFTGGNGSGTKMTQITTSTLDNYTLYAHWEANTYSIKFENSKGVAPNEILYKITDNIISLPTLSLDGYNFDGWYEDSAKYTNINPTTAKDYTLEAHWSLKSYTITYDLDGGTVSGNPTTYNIESNTFTLINPTKTDFKFTGWTGTNLNSKTTTVTIEQGSTGNRNYTAHWETSKFTITFIVDGEEIPLYFNEGETPSLGYIPTKNGHGFIGWSPSIVPVTENATYTAIFKPKYAIAFRPANSLGLKNLDYGQYFSDNLTYYYEGEQQTIAYAIDSAPPNNFAFLGLIVIKLTIETSDNPVTVINNAITTIESTNADTISDFEQLPFVVSTTSNRSLNFTVTNYNTLIVAYFKAIEYKINYLDAQNGTHSNTSSFTLLETGNIILNDLEVSEGYKFNGWYTGKNGTGTKLPSTLTRSYLTSLSNNYTINIYAQVITIIYNITYNLDGGSLTISNPMTYCVETPTFTLNNPNKLGYLFNGWYYLGQLYKTITITKGSTGNKIYTAQWTSNQSEISTITFEVDGTELINDSITALSGSNITAPSVDSEEYGMTGYNIDGWYIDEECTTKYTFSTMPSSDITLYGEWDYFIYQGFFPYLEEFQSATTNNITYIDSYEELSAWIDYIFFYNISDIFKIKLNFLSYASTSSLMENIPTLVYENMTCPHYPYRYGATAKDTMFLYITEDTINELNSLQTADPDKSEIYSQQDYAFAIEYTAKRSANNTQFNINKVADTFEVYNTNQLVYVLEKGYRPICISGSPAEIAYNKAKNILNQICDDSMSNIDKIKAIYEWMLLNVQYDNYALATAGLNDGSWAKYDAWYAEGVFNNGVAVCDGISKALTILAKIENIPIVRIQNLSNIINNNGHAWNKVYINSNWYGIDATHGDWSSTKYGVTGVSYANFLFTDNFKEGQSYIGSIHTNLEANTQYNYYASQTYTYNSSAFDLNIDSQSELTLLLMYIKNYDPNSTYLTIDISLANNYTEEQFKNFLQTSLSNASYQWSSYLFIYNTNSNGRMSYTIFLRQ